MVLRLQTYSSFFVKVDDKWFPNYEIKYEGKHYVRVSLQNDYDGTAYKRILVFGGDDIGMEKVYEDEMMIPQYHADIMYIVTAPVMNMDKFKKLGFSGY